jgi:hypothetical protein
MKTRVRATIHDLLEWALALRFGGFNKMAFGAVIFGEFMPHCGEAVDQLFEAGAGPRGMGCMGV